MRKRGILPQTLSPLDRLAYVGKSGMGALIYEPDHSEAVERAGIDLDWLAQQPQDVLEGGAEDVLDELLALNGSAADARPKAFIGFNRKTGHVIHGRQNLPKGYEPWLIKFANSQDGPDPGAMELVYSEIARQAGLMIPDTHLFRRNEGGSSVIGGGSLEGPISRGWNRDSSRLLDQWWGFNMASMSKHCEVVSALGSKVWSIKDIFYLILRFFCEFEKSAIIQYLIIHINYAGAFGGLVLVACDGEKVRDTVRCYSKAKGGMLLHSDLHWFLL